MDQSNLQTSPTRTMQEGDAAVRTTSVSSDRRGRPPLASPLMSMRAVSPGPGSPKFLPTPRSASLKRSAAPARIRDVQNLSSPLSTARPLSTTSASSPFQANIASTPQSRAATPRAVSIERGIRTTIPYPSHEVSTPRTVSIERGIRTTMPYPSHEVAAAVTRGLGLRLGPSSRDDSPSPRKSHASNIRRAQSTGSALRLAQSPANAASSNSLAENTGSNKTSESSLPAHVRTKSHTISVPMPTSPVQNSAQVKPASVSIPAVPRTWQQTSPLQSPRVVQRFTSSPTASAVVRSTSPFQSPRHSGQWNRVGTVLKATQAFTQSLSAEPQSMPPALMQPTQPAQPSQPPRSGQVAQPGQPVVSQIGSLVLTPSHPSQWHKVGAVMRASRAFADLVPGSSNPAGASVQADAQEGSVSSSSGSAATPLGNGADTWWVGLNDFNRGGALHVGTRSNFARPGSPTVHSVPMPHSFHVGTRSIGAARPGSPTSVSVSTQHILQGGGRLTPHRPSNAAAMSPYNIHAQHVVPSVVHPLLFEHNLKTILTGEVLPTETVHLPSGGSAADGVASPTAQAPPYPVGVAGAVGATSEVHEMPSHVYDTLENISNILKDREYLKATVIKNFKEAREDEAVGVVIVEDIENAALNKFEFYIFVDLISKAMDLPPYAFGNLELEYAAFDFNGHGTLNIKETYKFVKFHLKEYRRELGGKAAADVDIPTKTLAEAGYDILEVLGHGNQGFAKLAKDSTGQEVCLKVFDKERMRNDELNDMIEEFESMQLLSCKCIAGANEMFQDSLNYYMACELYRGGDFSQLTEKAREQGVIMDEDWYRGIFRQCFEGLKFMHEQAVMHCDIKEYNMMLKTTNFSDPEVVIIDLGVSHCLAASHEGVPHGTPGYVPPETLETLKWFPAGDTFSMGVAMFQVVAEMKPPEHGLFIDGCTTAKEVYRATLEREPPWSMLPEFEMPSLKNLLEQLLEKDRDRRPRPSKVLKHYWFTGVEAEKDSGQMSAELTKNTREFYKRLAPRNQFATMGFTASIIQGLDN